MQASRVFRQIWRINAVLILIGAALAVLGLATLVIEQITSGQGGNSAAPDASLRVQAASGHTLSLGQFELLSDTHFAVAPLLAEAPLGLGSSSETGETHNLLFLDLSSGETFWLLPTHDQELSSQGDLYDPSSPEPRSRLLGSLYLVRPVGSMADAPGRLLLVPPSGRPYLELAVGVTAVRASFVRGPSESTLLLERAGSHALLPIDLLAFTKLPERPVPIPAVAPSQ